MCVDVYEYVHTHMCVNLCLCMCVCVLTVTYPHSSLGQLYVPVSVLVPQELVDLPSSITEVIPL